MQGDPVLAVCTPAHWTAIEERLSAGAPLALHSSRQATVLDAHALLDRVVVNGAPRRERFHDEVGAIVRGLAVPGRRLRVYGEMVNLLAAEGDFASVLQLEHFWNTLAGEVPLTLLCGYFAEHFGAPRSSDALRRICEAHSEVRVQPADLLGSFLLQASR